MNIRLYVLLVALSVFLGAAILLVTGSPLLTRPLLGNRAFPAGTLLTWLGILALPVSIYTGIPALYRPANHTMRIYRYILISMISIAASWGLVSFLLAGNWSFSFSWNAPGFRGSPKASPYFWFYSYLAAGLPIVFLLVLGTHQWALWVIRKFRKKN